MVYCGKPSKGCSHCRERKIRCDQKEPGCGQCEKRQQKCPGYRNLVDLMFRDESSHVIKKAKARARKKANLGISRSATPSDSDGRLSATPEPRGRPLSLIVPPTPVASSPAGRHAAHHDDSSMLPSPESGSWPVTPPMARQYNLAPSFQENGFAWFFSRYVNSDETVPHQKFDFLPDVWKPSSSAREAHVDGVLASMTAVGLMGMASTTRSPALMDAARKSYGTALRLTEHALHDPVEAVKDTTMLSVLILGVFEMVAESAQRTMTVGAFRKHVNGAAVLAEMRGPAQFQTRAGRRMFSMLCQRYIVSCAQLNEPMPHALIKLWHGMHQTSEISNPSRRLMPLVWQVLQLRFEINKERSLTDPEIILDKLLAVDHEFETLTTQLPPSWRPRVFQVKQHHPAVFGGFCHLYSSLHHTNVWNHILTTRILLLETVLSTILHDRASFSPILSPTRSHDEYQKARRKLRYLVRDVTASVPQQLGLMNPADGSIDDGDSPPIATVEIRETPSPPTSPASRSSDSPSTTSTSTVYSPLSATTSPRQRTLHRPHASGLTILDVTKARGFDPEDEAERYMLLVSATSTVVWPLFVVGMSTACTAEMRQYVIGRLRTLYMETGIRQADGVANLLEEMDSERDADGEGEYEIAVGGCGLEPGPRSGTGDHSAAGSGHGMCYGLAVEAGWSDMHGNGGGQMPSVSVSVMGEDYGLGLVPLTSPEVVKNEFDMVWG